MPTDAERAVLTQEENLTQATRNLDIDALERIYADDIVMTNVLGATCNRIALIEEAKRGASQRQNAAAAGGIEASYEKEDLKVVSHGDTAVASYRFGVRMKGPGIDVHRPYRTTNVWVKRNGNWQIVGAHTAFVLDPQQVVRLESAAAGS